MQLASGYEAELVLGLIGSLIAGYLIGAERESRRKPAGISTHSLVIGGSMFFTFLSPLLGPDSPDRIAAGIVSGIGFLGAGIILRGQSGHITNLTTAAGIWFSASIGMALGMGWYLAAAIMTIFSIAVPRIPHLQSHVGIQSD
ncbi:MgtC/SapB family protein [Candidatus Woesearchaeota archaeon]|nr:MgtC/SapB family protein [Candidatus Woesearchaeota archaeon]